MSKLSKKPRDTNCIVAAIVGQATSGEPEPVPGPDQGKNQAAVALGRLGAQKGGKVRAEKLSAERRSEIARKAAEARWSREP